MKYLKNVNWLRVNCLLLWGLLGIYLVGLVHKAYLSDGWDGVVMLVLLLSLSWGVMHLLYKNAELKAEVSYLKREKTREELVAKAKATHVWVEERPGKEVL